MKQKISLLNSYSKNKSNYSWNCLCTSRSKFFRNTARQFKLAQYVKGRMAHTRGSEYEFLYHNSLILGEKNTKF